MDEFTKNHLSRWIANNRAEPETPEFNRTYILIAGFVGDYPDILESHGWPEIESLAEARMERWRETINR